MAALAEWFCSKRVALAACALKPENRSRIRRARSLECGTARAAPSAEGRMQPSQVSRLFDEAPQLRKEHQWLFRDFQSGLNSGEIRAPNRMAPPKSGWRANAW